ncbi:hypothetical protein RJT34_22884 [Clitoria ternatea]|uniref:Uncharacterized protein n=1 Tax=Clitoria ternatea TaxID=43366 RepID=A0AAN9FKQ3_CLITE
MFVLRKYQLLLQPNICRAIFFLYCGHSFSEEPKLGNVYITVFNQSQKLSILLLNVLPGISRIWSSDVCFYKLV